MRHILVADDHAVTRRGLRDLVDEIFPGAEVGEAVDGHELLAMIGSQDWDLLLLDALMPGPGFVPMLGEIRSLRPTIPLLVLTATTEIEYVVESMRAGANGLVRKSEADAELIRAVRLVADGGTYLHPETAAALARSMCEHVPSIPHLSLSDRELDVFRRIALGQAIKEVAFDLGLSGKTVATYLSRIRKKTGLVGSVDIARYALQHRLVD